MRRDDGRPGRGVLRRAVRLVLPAPPRRLPQPRRLAGAVARGDARPPRRHHLRPAQRRRRADACTSRARSRSAATPSALAFRDAHGHPLAVDKAGHLTRVFSETDGDVRRHIAEGTARAIADLRDKVGIDAHVSYGCLLGAVRDGHMIGHDSDADLAYLSRWTHPADVVRESFRMERELRRLGWKVVRMSGRGPEAVPPAARRPRGPRRRLRCLPRRGHLLPARRAQRTARPVGTDPGLHGDPRGRRARRAGRPGGGARVPLRSRPGASPTRRSARSTPGRASAASRAGCAACAPTWSRGTRLYRYRRAAIPRRRSSFAEWAETRMERGRTVADLGSGSGRDSAWFHARGHRVIGFDYSGAALRQTRRRLAKRGVENPDVRALPFNDLRAALLAGAELSREPEPPYLYARGLVGCLDAEARANLWRLCSMSLRRGGALFLEYAATRPGLRGLDPARSRQTGQHPQARARDHGRRWSGRPPRGRTRDSTSSTSPTRMSPGSRSAGTDRPRPGTRRAR